jgi:hypothetical protein
MKMVVYSYCLTAITVIDNSTVIDTALNMALNPTRVGRFGKVAGSGGGPERPAAEKHV